MAKVLTKVNSVEKAMKELGYKPEHEGLVRAYVENNIAMLMSNKDEAKSLGLKPFDYAVDSIQNAYNDGDIAPDTEDQSSEDDDQEIIEVSQDEVKKALKTLLTTKNDMIALLYRKHDEYNQEFFGGQLSVPLITIDKLSNRTLGNYTEGADRMAIENHIRFNQNFIALNTEERILETLRHEMIHQWQDEVLYVKKGTTELRDIEIVEWTKDGLLATVQAKQKKRPKEWHNNDFKAMAKVVNIPAQGAKCYGNPAKMPEPKSYNRKFACGCVASNGYPLTVWSTREVKAKCLVCNRPFVELNKNDPKAKTIEVTMSHVEKPNQDAVLDSTKDRFRHFERFETKRRKDEFVESLELGSEGSLTEMEQGIYQKGHNMYAVGYRYWVAYNVAEEIHPDDIHDVEEQKHEVETKKSGLKTKVKNKNTSEDGGKKGKLVKFPTQEEPKEDEPMKTAEREYSDQNPQDILDLYIELGTTRKVAEKLGISQPTVMSRAKKFGIDFKTGTINPPQA